MPDAPSSAWIALLAVAVGLAAALIVWSCSRALLGVPKEDREFKDSPPLAFRLAWWPIQWIGHPLRRWMPARRQAALQSRLRQAGLEFTLDAAQFVSARLVCALAGVLAGALVLQASLSALAPLASHPLLIVAAGAFGGWLYPALWLRDRVAARRRELLKQLPFYLDVMTLCVEAGLNLQGALNQAVAKGPPGVLHDELQRVLRDIRAGKPRAAALRGMAERMNESGVSQLTTTVIHAESAGMSLGPVLRVQAEQRRSERFLRAEKLALEAPVKMLLPLIACIFPCTFMVLFFPVAMKFIASGL